MQIEQYNSRPTRAQGRAAEPARAYVLVAAAVNAQFGPDSPPRDAVSAYVPVVTWPVLRSFGRGAAGGDAVWSGSRR
jgi:hypothetical protein